MTNKEWIPEKKTKEELSRMRKDRFLGMMFGILISFIIWFFFILPIEKEETTLLEIKPMYDLQLGKMNIDFKFEPAEVTNYDECDDSDFMDNCKLIFYDDGIGYIIMEVDYNKFTEYLQSAVKEVELPQVIR